MKAIGFFVLAAAIFAAYALHQRHGAIPPGEDESPYEKALVDHKCPEPESVDRVLLQQTWFHDRQFTQLAGTFGQTGFSLYSSGGAADPVEGAYCIAGNTLHVRYYERAFVPVAIDLSTLAVSFGTRLIPMEADSFVVRELTKQRISISIASDGRNRVLYRRN